MAKETITFKVRVAWWIKPAAVLLWLAGWSESRISRWLVKHAVKLTPEPASDQET